MLCIPRSSKGRLETKNPEVVASGEKGESNIHHLNYLRRGGGFQSIRAAPVFAIGGNLMETGGYQLNYSRGKH
jgi:hypothetical protein